MANSNATYIVELERWGIKNDGTDAFNTTNGINSALVWASQNNYIEVILPRGNYLIDEKNSIEPQSFMTLNLNGSILRIRDNDLPNYALISFKKNQMFSRITNGKIEGDKDSHDYSSGGTHEGGYGIQIGSFTPPSDGGNNTRFITLDNLEVFNCTGDAITVNSTFGQIFPTPTQLSNSWEQGSISLTDGTLINNPNKIRSTLKIDMNQTAIKKYGYFGLYGNGYGSLGADITCDYYDVLFYKNDETLVSSRNQIQFFDEVNVPSDANYAKVVLHQSKIPESKNCLINVRVPSFPSHTYIEKCDLRNCRRQGISICGTKHIYIRDNNIHHIGGTPPQAGIDVEDGYDLNQFIYIEGNNFHDNHFYDVVVVNGKSVYILKNKITDTLGQGASLAINGGTDKVFVSDNTFHKAKAILSGNVMFSNNFLYGTQLNVLGKYINRPIYISDNLFHNSKLVLDTPYAYLVKIDSCRFYNDSNKLNAFSNFQWTLELRNQPQIISNCIFEGKDVLYNTYVLNSTKGGWLFNDTLFKSGTTLIGRYVNCTFIGEMSTFGVKGTSIDTVELIGCKVISKDRFNSLITANDIKSFKLINCYIEKPNGHIFRGGNISDEIILSENTFKITDDSLKRTIILFESSFTGNSILVKNNNISARYINQVGIENATTNNPQVIISNNSLNNANIKFNGTETLLNNIIDGKIDHY